MKIVSASPFRISFTKRQYYGRLKKVAYAQEDKNLQELVRQSSWGYELQFEI